MRIREVWGKEEKIDINSGKYFNREEEIVGLDPLDALRQQHGHSSYSICFVGYPGIFLGFVVLYSVSSFLKYKYS